MTTKKKEQAKVVSQEQLADGIFSMWIQTEAAGSARPGQFISMYTNDGSKLLPRPISICEIDKEGGKLRVVYRVTGEKTGTEEFSQMKAGDTIPVCCCDSCSKVRYDLRSFGLRQKQDLVNLCTKLTVNQSKTGYHNGCNCTEIHQPYK